MRIKVIDGKRCTDLAGAAEYLGISENTARMYSAPSRRPTTGWPEPAAGGSGQRIWYALTALKAYRKQRDGPAPPPVAGDPYELIDIDGFAELRGITRTTMEYYVHLSRDDWKTSEDGYLPRPDPRDCQPALHGGTVHRWRRGRAAQWAFPAERRVSTGRPPTDQVVTLADLDAVLAATGQQTMSGRELAAALSHRKGYPVSLQTVKRLRRRARQPTAGTTA